jgi:membrane protease subunit HflK
MLGRKKTTTSSVDKEVSSGVGRTLGSLGLFLVVLALLAGWGYTGYYKIDEGEEGVLLRLGTYHKTVTRTGPHIHLPPPFETLKKVKVSKIQQEEFLFHEIPAGEAPGVEHFGPDGSRLYSTNMQTKANNIVNLSFVVQYRTKNAFESLYKLTTPRSVIRDASQAAVREVVGRTTIDGVLQDQRAVVQLEAAELLQQILDDYESGIEVQYVQLQEVLPPKEVEEAFADVTGATQDREGAVSQAQGYANEIIPKARGEAAALRADAEAYRDSKISIAKGEADRFISLYEEYQKAPAITRRRLYLETMEQILPSVQTVLVDPELGNLLPVLPIGSGDSMTPPVGAGKGAGK